MMEPGRSRTTTEAEDRNRERIVLDVVERAAPRRFVISPHGDGSAAYQGLGASDYVCGACGRPVAVGVRPGMFQSLAFACPCGALNQVP